jgi:flagellar biosynthetic protein FliR
MAGFIIITPMFTGRMIPVLSKVFFAFFVALLVGMSGNFNDLPNYGGNTIAYAGVLALEFSVGFIIGFTIYFIITIMFFVGQLVDYKIGFAMVNVFDPIAQIQVPITGNLYFLVMTAFLARVGVIQYFVYQVADSYTSIPIGQALIYGNQDLMMYIIMRMTVYFEMGVRIAMPIIGPMMIIDVALGILVKATPQMNIFVVGMPLKVFAGMMLIWVLTPLLGEIFIFLAENMVDFSFNVQEYMSPSQ